MLYIYMALKSKLCSNKLTKKLGDDKLVVSLVLIAVGVVLCFIYRSAISTSIGDAVNSLDDKISNLFQSTTNS
ncbi:hypothetical protein SAMN02745134_03752 [Clostridium acidisoli DSM 12555]|uniref:Uncharacterized protein n=1 Tax=Clostridium acidisoli DSM 12555 TaxID=1121291 RepID=A0A1W1XYQ7_9CLOT|nr:hypothetical protein [Clostridium acidisoli]SMC29005.1 hypothetical protein SAMN02745134_03752 [Clostridium acidisoli DSM 12555]